MADGVLEGKVVLVNGAGRGIGAEIARLAAAEGAKVVVNDLGATVDGKSGADIGPAQEVVASIEAAGGDETAFARTVAEVLKLKEIKYVEAAKAAGIPDRKIILTHILKNALPTLVVAISFAVGSVILIESALNFLNIGVPDDTPTLGAVLRSGREHIEAWWLVVFPGLAIFFLIYLFNRIGDKIALKHT